MFVEKQKTAMQKALDRWMKAVNKATNPTQIVQDWLHVKPATGGHKNGSVKWME